MSYQVEVNEVEYCKVKVKYKADASTVSNKTQDVLNKIRKWPVPGFRPGHATDLSLKMKYKEKVDELVTQEMLNTAHEDVLFETKMKTIGMPNVENHRIDGNSFDCELLYMKKPEFTLGKYKELEIPKPPVDRTVDQISEEVIAGLKKQIGDVRPYDENDFVQQGDKITMDLQVGLLPKEEAKLYIVGSNILQDFDTNIYGMSAGETREFDIVHNGEKAHITVTVHMGLKNVPFSGDDEEFAKKAGFESWTKMHEDIIGFAQKQQKELEKQAIVNQVQKHLLANNDFKIPEWFEQVEAQKIAMSQGMDWQKLDDAAKNNLLSTARDNSKLAFVLDSIETEEPESQLTHQEVLDGIGKFLVSQGVNDPKSWVQNNMHNGVLHSLVARYKMDHILGWIAEKVKVVE